MSLLLINTSLCSPARLYLCTFAVWCWTRSVQWLFGAFLFGNSCLLWDKTLWEQWDWTKTENLQGQLNNDLKRKEELQIQVIILCKTMSDHFYTVIVKHLLYLLVCKYFFTVWSASSSQKKGQLCILSDQADKHVLFRGGYWFSASHLNVAFWTI